MFPPPPEDVSGTESSPEEDCWFWAFSLEYPPLVVEAFAAPLPDLREKRFVREEKTELVDLSALVGVAALAIFLTSSVPAGVLAGERLRRKNEEEEEEIFFDPVLVANSFEEEAAAAVVLGVAIMGEVVTPTCCSFTGVVILALMLSL